jgi:site-specific recombinase XerD
MIMKKSKSHNLPLFFSFTWDFLNEYLPNQIGRSPYTIESYGDSLTIFRRYLNEYQRISLKKITFSDCTKDLLFDFRNYLEQRGNEASTINVRMTAIRAYLYYAADRNVSIQSVALSAASIPPRKKIQKEKETLSEEALAAILAAPPLTKIGMRDRAILIMLYDSAIRLEELLSVKLHDITLSGEYACILIHGKGKKERRISLTDLTVGHLKQYLQVYHADSIQTADLFSTTIKGCTSAMSPGNVQRIIKKYSDIARTECHDMPKSVYAHMLRRTRACNLYQDGVAIELVSAILGHARIETTKTHYAKPSLAQLRESMESVPTPVAGEKPLWIGSEDEMARACGLR